jgi:hypothetical protein
MPLVTIKDCLNCHIDHEWLFESMSLRELRVIKKMTGMGQRAFAEAGDEGDPEALAALIYILHLRDRIKIPFDDVDLDFKTFTMEPTEQELAELAAAEAMDEDEDPKEIETVNGL